ncbi:MULTISPECIES: hypothetical protein [unclassified Dysgonomonas]|uniref:hypothetical protein n=1 Tax=unclassified Dysgonomonas TaxID=2630389 RepID=UPI002477172B|nr:MULTISPECIES: hypothetical protein [unclassified Dysgonomonas]
MKSYFIILCLFVFFACNSKKTEKVSKEIASELKQESVFSPVLEREIKSFINYVEQEIGRYSEYKLFYVLRYDKDKQGRRFLKLHADYFYDKSRAFGYTFIDDHLVIYYAKNYSFNLFHEKSLIPFKDSIPGYKDSEQCDLKYELPSRTIKIVRPDSLVIVSTDDFW